MLSLPWKPHQVVGLRFPPSSIAIGFEKISVDYTNPPNTWCTSIATPRYLYISLKVVLYPCTTSKSLFGVVVPGKDNFGMIIFGVQCIDQSVYWCGHFVPLFGNCVLHFIIKCFKRDMFTFRIISLILSSILSTFFINYPKQGVSVSNVLVKVKIGSINRRRYWTLFHHASSRMDLIFSLYQMWKSSMIPKQGQWPLLVLFVSPPQTYLWQEYGKQNGFQQPTSFKKSNLKWEMIYKFVIKIKNLLFPIQIILIRKRVRLIGPTLRNFDIWLGTLNDWLWTFGFLLLLHIFH